MGCGVEGVHAQLALDLAVADLRNIDNVVSATSGWWVGRVMVAGAQHTFAHSAFLKLLSDATAVQSTSGLFFMFLMMEKNRKASWAVGCLWPLGDSAAEAPQALVGVLGVLVGAISLMDDQDLTLAVSTL